MRPERRLAPRFEPASLLTFGLLYLFRVAHEERMMLDRFGAEYRRYMGRTGRLFPGRGELSRGGHATSDF